jgi:hypothetical protein
LVGHGALLTASSDLTEPWNRTNAAASAHEPPASRKDHANGSDRLAFTVTRPRWPLGADCGGGRPGRGRGRRLADTCEQIAATAAAEWPVMQDQGG